MARFLRILGWSASILLCLVVASAGALYLFLTSDYLHGQLEGRASDYIGRKNQGCQSDWGSTARVWLDGVEIANAAWGKAPHMLKVEQIDFDIRLWPLLKSIGDGTGSAMSRTPYFADRSSVASATSPIASILLPREKRSVPG